MEPNIAPVIVGCATSPQSPYNLIFGNKAGGGTLAIFMEKKQTGMWPT
jgi:hypothetical protein